VVPKQKSRLQKIFGRTSGWRVRLIRMSFFNLLENHLLATSCLGSW
jgi:hypothetical protein